MTIDLDHDDFNATVAGVRTAADHFAVRRDHVCREVDALLAGAWRGAAADSFAEAWADWRLAAQRVVDGLVAMGSLLDAVHRDLSDRDEQAHVRLDAVAARVAERLG